MHLDPDDLRLARIGRSVTAADVPTDDAPPEVWDGLLAAVRAEQRPQLRVVGGTATVPVARRPRRAARVAAVAAAAALVVATTAVLAGRGGPDPVELVADTDLTLVAPGAGSGSGAARLERRTDGTHLVVVVAEMSSTAPTDFYELWLLDPAATDPRPIGRMAKGTGGTLDLKVPDGVDPARYPVVDISSELDDGDEQHSGRSVLRGRLT